MYENTIFTAAKKREKPKTETIRSENLYKIQSGSAGPISIGRISVITEADKQLSPSENP